MSDPRNVPANVEGFSHRACDLLFALRATLPTTRPEILKHEMKVFFVKYNDPIYVKLEKLDIMIRLASQANIAQVSRGWCPGGLCEQTLHKC